ncbi:MAG: hypothetical protein ACOYOA_16595, partial [Saprospiraceae bacterium]
RNGKLENDQDAAAFFNLDQHDKKYRRLRAELLDSLFDMVFFLNPSTFPDNYNLKKGVELFKKECIYKILRNFGAKHSRVDLSVEILELAISCEIIDSAVAVCKRIINEYSLIYESTKMNFDEYCALLNELLELQKAEIMAASYQKRYSLHFLQGKQSRLAHGAAAQAAADEIDQYAYKKMTYIFHLHRFMLKMTAAQLQYKWQQSLDIYDEALTFLSGHNGQNSMAMATVSISRCFPLIALQRYNASLNVLNEAEKAVIVHSQTWYNIQRYKMHTLFHALRFQDSYDLLLEVTTHSRFNTLEQNHKEPWFIFKAYLLLFAKARHLNLQEEEMDEMQNWHLHDMIGDITLFSKDKRGFNIPILIAQLLNNLLDKAYVLVEGRLEALLKYRSRHLTEHEYFRTDVFIDLLSVVVKNNYDPSKFSPKVGQLLSKLESIPYSIADQPEEIEILPYEKLFQLTISKL